MVSTEHGQGVPVAHKPLASVALPTLANHFGTAAWRHGERGRMHEWTKGGETLGQLAADDNLVVLLVRGTVDYQGKADSVPMVVSWHSSVAQAAPTSITTTAKAGHPSVLVPSRRSLNNAVSHDYTVCRDNTVSKRASVVASARRRNVLKTTSPILTEM